MDEWLQVQVMIPRDRIGEFHEMFGGWLQQPSRQNLPIVHSPESAAEQRVEPSEKSWSDGSPEELLHDAREFYRSLSPTAKRFLNHLVEAPGHQATANELAQELGRPSPNSVAGVTASFGFQRKAINRQLPYGGWRAPGGATTYLLEPEVADLFRRAREVRAH